MDTVTKVLIETIGDIGFRVDVTVDDVGRHVVEATSLKDGERFIVRGSDLYEAAVELAGQIGIELEDG